MNERFRELAVQAHAKGNTLHYYNPEFIEKFAELIVRECMEQVWYTREDGINGNVSQVIKDRIKEHFGVEERKGWVCPKCGIDRTKEACPKGHTAAITGDCPMTATAQSGVE
jgi:hypothetical protein